MVRITLEAKKVDILDDAVRARACAAVDHYLSQTDPFLDTSELRSLKRTFTERDGLNARRFLEQLTPRVSPLLEELFGDSLGKFPEKELLEASCFYRQVTAVLGELDGKNKGDENSSPDDYVLDLCAGNSLAGILWLLEGRRFGEAPSVYAVDWKETKLAKLASQKVRASETSDRFSFKKLNLRNTQAATAYISEVRWRHQRDEIARSHGLVVAIHACGSLTDVIIDLAISQQLPFAVVPCCYDRRQEFLSPLPETTSRHLSGYFPSQKDYVDTLRIAAIYQRGYQVTLRVLPSSVTDHNRIIIGAPQHAL